MSTAGLLECPTSPVKHNVGGTDPRGWLLGQLVAMPNAKHLGALIRALRDERDLNQADVAEAVGISRSYLAGIETGRDVPGREVLMAIADFYKVSIDQLRHGTVGPGSPRPREVVEDPDELALLDFWRGLTPEQKTLVYRLLNVPPRRDAAA